MLPAPHYKPGKYPPSSLYPRFGDAGSLPPQFRKGNEHLQAMIARRKASTQLLADRAPQQAERPGEQYYDAEPQLPAEPGELDDMPPLEEPEQVPAQMPGRQPPPDPGPEREASPARQGQGIYRNVMHGVGWGLFQGMRGMYHGGGAVGVGLYHIGAGALSAADQVNNYDRGRSPPPEPAPDEPRAERRAEVPRPSPKSRAAPAQFRIDTPEQNTSASSSGAVGPRPRGGRRSPPPRADPNTSAGSFSGCHRGPSWI